MSVDESFPPSGDIGVQVIPGGEYAVTTHFGPYRKLGQTYAKLLGQWLPRSGRELRPTPCFEVYLNDPQSTEPEGFGYGYPRAFGQQGRHPTLGLQSQRERQIPDMPTQTEIDLYKLHKTEYAAPRKPALVDIKPATYLAISGQGAPGGERFGESIGALYGVAFTVKMTRKFAGKQDYAVCKLEGQWWADGAMNFAKLPREQWQWKLLIRTPDFVSEQDVREAVAVLLKRGKGEDAKRVRLETLAEGRCVQMLHVGPYERESETVAVMAAFAEKQGLGFSGKHHEIYLSDPRRVPPERLKTILRQPVRTV